tara:strand:- start:2063 stop:2506 length:444 start_codon:yes stop_codon:yes gene_type:complete
MQLIIVSAHAATANRLDALLPAPTAVPFAVAAPHADRHIVMVAEPVPIPFGNARIHLIPLIPSRHPEPARTAPVGIATFPTQALTTNFIAAITVTTVTSLLVAIIALFGPAMEEAIAARVPLAIGETGISIVTIAVIAFLKALFASF